MVIITLTSGNSYLERLDFFWDVYQIVVLIPLFFFSVYRFYHQLPIEDYMGTENEKKRIPKYPYDNCLKLVTIFPLLYYKLQSICLIMSWKYDNLVNLITLFQSVTVIVALWTSMSINYYPWFLIFPVALFFLNNVTSWYYLSLYIFYLVSMVICVIGLRLPPWKTRNNYLFIAKLIITLVILSVINKLIK